MSRRPEPFEVPELWKLCAGRTWPDETAWAQAALWLHRHAAIGGQPTVPHVEETSITLGGRYRDHTWLLEREVKERDRSRTTFPSCREFRLRPLVVAERHVASAHTVASIVTATESVVT